jgi:mannose-6-phosphate isomerase-like protein (cupin superfamily)
MGDYTVVRLDEVENSGPGVGIDPEDLDIRFMRKALGTGDAGGVSVLRYSPGYASPIGHRHSRQVEVYVLVSGRALARLDDEVIELEPITALRVAPTVKRAFRAAGEEPALIVAFGIGPSGDGEMDADWWRD